ncbi:Ger(x)C family spore germination protein [Siminovitchia sp. FSL H7-0308]|uniref:Ger(X)C family germination protein n=1 Tax=Siminovitchia thermophila TaxID=1245522 RepID=A0ABS2REX2_9BACI|nr:Ger(x)C family spore germination protein [Siminovitchia thermophila]MBM7717418.1 Ger(x)C family germination protein [Siminovitchia thermophila]ONK22125.1 spore gernimation protein GerC [Bacillus sp. VT-16-64]
MKRFFLLLFSAFSIIFLTTGCGDKEELERQAFVIALGLDKDEKDHLISVTFQVANPQVNTSKAAEAQNEQPSNIISVSAPDIFSAKELTQSSLSRKVTFAHLRTIIIGEELAKTDEFRHIIDSAVIDPELRRESIMIVSQEKASDYIHKNKPALESSPHKYYEFMEERWDSTGLVSKSNLNNFYHRSEGELALIIYATTKRNETVHTDEDTYKAGQVPQKAGDPVQMIGSAVMQNRKMIGTLNGEETRMALLIKRKSPINSFVASFIDPLNEKFRISARVIKDGHTKINVSPNQDPLKVAVSVPIKLQVRSNPGLTNYTTNEKNQTILKKSIEKQLEKDALKLIKKTKVEYKGEPFAWHINARKHFWTMKDFQKYDWEKHYQHAKVDVRFKVTIENFGAQIKPIPIKPSEKD